LKALGYDVMIFTDSDGSIAAEATALRGEGIDLAMWDGSVCTEQQFFNDLPWSGVQQLLTIAQMHTDEQAICDQVNAKITRGTIAPLAPPITGWTDSAALRDTLGRTAAKKGWYKQLHLGEEAGRTLAQHLGTMSATNTAAVVETLRVWLHRE